MGRLKQSNAASGAVNSKKFYCPIDSCVYREGSERFFKSKRLLNQHNVKVHGDKKFACLKCSKGYPTEWQQKYHEKICGIVLSCNTCGQKYNSRESIFTHCRRTGHDLPTEFALKSSRKSSCHTNPSVLMPVILVVQQQPLPFQDAKKGTWTECAPSFPNSTMPRRILPKETSSPVGTLVNHPATNGIDAIKTSIATQTDGKCNCEHKTVSTSSSSNNIDKVIDIGANTSPSTDSHKKERNTRRKNAAGTQTCKRCIIKRAMESAKLQVQQESRGSQCSPRIKCHYRSRKPSVVRENIQTQTTESVVGRMKKPVKQKVVGRVRRNLMSLGDRELAKEQNTQAAQSAWSSLDVILGSQWMARCSSGTQTSPRNSYFREMCDSQTLTDEILLANSVCEMNSSENHLDLASKVGEVLESDLSGNAKQEKSTLGLPTTGESIISSTDQADSGYSLFSYMYDNAPALSHMETQTCEELGFDFLTNMETQTTNDFFNDLELSDIQTQTPWTDLLDFCDNLDASQFSAEIQTDVTSRDLSLEEKDIADFIDTQTQTCSSAVNADLTNAYTQTLCLDSYFAPVNYM